MKIFIPESFNQIEIGKLKPHPKNIKIHTEEQVEGIAEAIKLVGFVQPIVIDKSNLIRAGHGRFEAAKLLEMPKVPFVKLEGLTKKQLNAYMILDNKLNESKWSKENMYSIMAEMGDFDFEPYQIQIDEFRTYDIKDEEDIPPVPEKPKSKLGDIYRLGNHIVMCGDSTQNLDKLLEGITVDLLLTDPPYGVNYAEKNKYLNSIGKGNRIETPINNDNIQDYREFFNQFLKPIPFSPINSVYVFLSGRHTNDLTLAFDDQNIYWTTWLVWVKNNHVLGRMDYSTKHELILFGWKGKHKFYGGFQTSVLEYPKPQVSDLHPTMKPVELLIKLITNSTKTKSIVYDPFLGSGSTLIACEQTNRICYGIEIDPAYVDVTIKRWENLTNRKATKL